MTTYGPFPGDQLSRDFSRNALDLSAIRSHLESGDGAPIRRGLLARLGSFLYGH